MSEDLKRDEETGQLIGQKRQNTDNGGPASKKANLTDTGKFSFVSIQDILISKFTEVLDTVQIKVLIPSGAVGALIGKGGETMRNLKNDSGCRVQMSKNQEVYHGIINLILHKDLYLQQKEYCLF